MDNVFRLGLRRAGDQRSRVKWIKVRLAVKRREKERRVEAKKRVIPGWMRAGTVRVMRRKQE